MSRLTLLASLLVLFVAGMTFQSTALSQSSQAPRRRGPDELLRLSIAAETPGLAEPFMRHLATDPNIPNPEHVHTVVRTPNGNDYGKDLLRLHYQQHPHNTGGQ